MRFATVLLCLLPGTWLRAQVAAPFERRNTFAVFAEYSPYSAHILLGRTPNRRLTGVGVSYERGLWQGRHARLNYAVEFRPFIVSSDPQANTTVVGTLTTGGMNYQFGPQTYTYLVAACQAGTNSYTTSDGMGSSTTTTETTTCDRRSTLGQAGSPIGLRLSFRPTHRLQPTFTSNGGYMFTTKPIPSESAGSFNFTFNFGGGVEYFLHDRRSIRSEVLVQHYSNHGTADNNPAVDSVFLRLGYAFGH